MLNIIYNNALNLIFPSPLTKKGLPEYHPWFILSYRQSLGRYEGFSYEGIENI